MAEAPKKIGGILVSTLEALGERLLALGDFDEDKHPRGKDGKFSSGDGDSGDQHPREKDGKFASGDGNGNATRKLTPEKIAAFDKLVAERKAAEAINRSVESSSPSINANKASEDADKTGTYMSHLEAGELHSQARDLALLQRNTALRAGDTKAAAEFEKQYDHHFAENERHQEIAKKIEVEHRRRRKS